MSKHPFYDEMLKIEQEINTWRYLAKTLTQEHQQNVKLDIMATVKHLERELFALKELQDLTTKKEELK